MMRQQKRTVKEPLVSKKFQAEQYTFKLSKNGNKNDIQVTRFSIKF